MAGMRAACGRVCDAAESDLFSAVTPHVTDTTFTVPKRPTELSRNYKLPGRGKYIFSSREPPLPASRREHGDAHSSRRLWKSRTNDAESTDAVSASNAAARRSSGSDGLLRETPRDCLDD